METPIMKKYFVCGKVANNILLTRMILLKD